MSHEPTDEELRAAIDTWGKPGTGGITISLTAANTLRDRRIRAEALEEAARAYETGEDWDVFRDAAKAIRALKDKGTTHE